MHRILVCDSASIVQFVLQRYLIDDDVQVDYAKTPRDLIRMLESQIPDIIFLEAEIAGGKGKFVCDFLARKAATQGIPVVLSTRLSEGAIVANELAGWPGVKSIIRKPLASDRVKRELYEIFRGLAASEETEDVRKAI